jgi:hypothetical protein
MVYLFAKSRKYYYDNEAVREYSNRANSNENLHTLSSNTTFNGILPQKDIETSRIYVSLQNVCEDSESCLQQKSSGESQGKGISENGEVPRSQTEKNQNIGIQTIEGEIQSVEEGKDCSETLRANREMQSRAKEKIRKTQNQRHRKSAKTVEALQQDEGNEAGTAQISIIAEGQTEEEGKGPSLQNQSEGFGGGISVKQQAQENERKCTLQSNGGGMAADTGETKVSLPLLQQAQQETDNGPRDSIEQGGTSHQAKCSGGVPKLQRQKRGKNHNPVLTSRNLRSVWCIGTQAFKGAHFATFPEALVEPCIKAGTSEKGNCPKCGRPWARVIAPSADYAKKLGTWTPDTDADKELRGQIGFAAHGKKNACTADYQTLGWKPCCKCQTGDPVPAVVFDCFSGAGTVAVVAERLGRNWIGCEINPEYIQIAQNRLANKEVMF